MFNAPHGSYSSGKPHLTFGVVSDVHVLAGRKGILKSHTTETFEHTLGWFRDQGADAVVIAGDIADSGFIIELQAVADAWFKIFPDNKAPDGRTVEKVFVAGNHDIGGFAYRGYGEKIHPDPAVLAKNILVPDFKGHWERMFHEPYADIYAKQVKGYTFIGQHWTPARDGKPFRFERIKPFMEKNASKLIDPKLPFFYTQHPHLKDTCYGPYVWGHDAGIATEVFSAFPNAVAFSGHSHCSLVDERSIWQGAFTSIGTASLRYASNHRNGVPSVRCYENSKGRNRFTEDGMKVMPRLLSLDSRQGLLVKVYSDVMTVARREFLSDTFLGDEWVVPLPVAESKPYAFAARAKKALAPEFPAGSKAVVTMDKAMNRDKKKVDACLVAFPQADAKAGTRVFDYELVLETEGRKRKEQKYYMLAKGYCFAKEVAAKLDEFVFKIPATELPKGKKFRFAVSPRESFGKKGKAIYSDWMQA
jgi:hypothetical protein